MLVVQELLPDKDIRGNRKYRCLCDCGNEHIATTTLLNTGRTKSCGCLVHNPVRTKRDRIPLLKKALYSSAITCASRYLGMESDITIEEYSVLIEQPCHYCGKRGTNFKRD